MIQIPELRFGRSINKSNVSVNALGDWLEANLVFGEEPVTKSAVVDLLVKNNICAEGGQDLAHSIAADGWTELKQRSRWGGLSERFEMSRTQISEDILWMDSIARSFFLLLSLLKIFPDWGKAASGLCYAGKLIRRSGQRNLPCDSSRMEFVPSWLVTK